MLVVTLETTPCNGGILTVTRALRRRGLGQQAVGDAGAHGHCGQPATWVQFFIIPWVLWRVKSSVSEATCTSRTAPLAASQEVLESQVQAGAPASPGGCNL